MENNLSMRYYIPYKAVDVIDDTFQYQGWGLLKLRSLISALREISI